MSGHRIHRALFVVAVACATACSGARPPRAPLPASSADDGRVPGVAYPGYGLRGCAVGDPLSACTALLGTPTVDGEYASFTGAGVEVSLDAAQTVRSVFVLYQWTHGAPFAGTVDRDIDAASTADDVLAAYGPPTRTSDSVVSEYGEYPGAADHTLEYRDASFTFYDGTLAHVALWAPDPAP